MLVFQRAHVGRALLGLHATGPRNTIAIGLLQATSLPFIVTATQIGITLGQISPETGAALVCAGLLSVLIFPLVALGLLCYGAFLAFDARYHRV